MAKITVRDISINIISADDQDYISLTDMLKAKEGQFYIENGIKKVTGLIRLISALKNGYLKQML
jgi:hypothetical protein